MGKLTAICVIAALAIVGLVDSKCQNPRMGRESVYCVCSEVEKCDADFSGARINAGPKGTASGFRTSRAGDRLEPHDLYFTNAEETNATDLKIHINVDKTFQKIIGFGGAFTDSTGLNIAKLSRKLQDDVMKEYFGRDGIEYKVGRIVIGGCDFSTRGYSYDDNAEGDETLSGFALQPEDYKYKLPFIQIANQLSGNSVKYFGSPWAAPAWMKTNKQLNHGGFLIGEPGTKYYKLFAKYIVKFYQEYRKQGVNLWGLTIVNEPHFGFDKNYWFNVLGFSAEQERDYVKLDLYPELAAAGFGDQKIMIYDDNVGPMENFTDICFSDEEANKRIAGVAFHWYDNLITPRNDILDKIHEKYPDKFFLSTEACDTWKDEKTGEYVKLGNWAMFNRYADDIIEDLNHWTGGWIDWNMVLDEFGGPNWVHNLVDAPILVNETANEYYKQPIFYALGHFSKFLVPDSVRIEHKVASGNSKDVLVTVFERPDKSKVVTILNKREQPVKVELHDPANGYMLVNVHASSLESIIYQ